MGRVYLGTSPGGRKVAIKVVHSRGADDPEFRSRFAREVDAARRVGGFHTAAVVDADPEADFPWMATAYIPGPSLAEAVARRGPLDEAGVRELGAALAEGLAAIHACGLIHRDLKPSNVILADDGPRIIDFGIAKGTDATALTGSNAVLGTLHYMSPEQLQGHELTPGSDVFALGAVLAYAATGRNPFEAPTMPAVVTRILRDPPSLDPLAGDLRDTIAGCLAKEPGRRPSPAALLSIFSTPRSPGEPIPREASAPGPALADTPPQAPDTPPTSTIEQGSPAPPWPTQARSRRLVLIAVGVTAAVALAVLGVLLSDHPASTTPAATPTITATVTAPAGIETGAHFLVNDATSGCLDQDYANGIAHPEILSYPCTYGSNELWDVYVNPNGTYSFRNTRSGGCLNQDYHGGVPHPDVIAYPCGTNANQDWIVKQANGTTYLINEQSGDCLDQDYSGGVPHEDVLAYSPCNYNSNEGWAEQ